MILIDPLHLFPLSYVFFVRCNEMKALRIDADRMPKFRDMTAQNEIERRDLLVLRLAPFERIL